MVDFILPKGVETVGEGQEMRIYYLKKKLEEVQKMVN